MRDFLPADKARRERVLAVIRERYRAHGFDEIETPVMEDYDRLHAGIGGDNEKLAFNVLKRGLDADAIRAAADDAAALSDLGLRYDLTVPLARFYATHRAELPTVFRSIQMAPVWRAERPQKGATASSCSATSTSSATRRAAPRPSFSSRASTRSTRSVWRAAHPRQRPPRARLDARQLRLRRGRASGVLITIDKLDKIGPRASSPSCASGAPRRPSTRSRRSCAARRRSSTVRSARGDPQGAARGAPDDIVADLVAIGDAVSAARGVSQPTRRARRSRSTRSSCAAWATTRARSSSSPTRASTTRSAAAVATTA
jgi:histidyl-tRNA synthetase